MNYEYTVVYKLEGVSNDNLDADKIVFENNDIGITVTLTSDVNRHCLNIDKGVAIALLLLTEIFGGKKSTEPFDELDSEVRKIQEERASKCKDGAFLIITIAGSAELNINEKTHRETEQFRVCFDSFGNNDLKNKHYEKVHAILAAIAILIAPEYHAERVTDGIVFFDEHSKPLYRFTVRGGQARLVLRKRVDCEKEAQIANLISLSLGNSQLRTPFRLLTQSLETTQDNLRAFLSAWTALEIFIHKVFPTYEEQFIAGIVNAHNSNGVDDFLGRIKSVMKDKYRLTDKLSLIASFVSDEVTEDIELFKRLKDIRDGISHGQEFDEEALPVEDSRKLVSKYLKNHMLVSDNA